MVIVGGILIVVGIILFFVQRGQKAKAFSIKSARPSTIAELHQMAGEIAQEIGGGNWRDYVKLYGTIHADSPLMSELKQEPCVHYKMTVQREYETTVVEKDSDGKSQRKTERRSETVSSNQQSMPFQLQDATGEITINPKGATIETVKVLDEFRSEQSMDGANPLGKFAVNLAQSAAGGDRTLGYKYSESILPIGREVLVVGTVSDGTHTLTVGKPNQTGQKFILSLKTDEELARAADSGAKNSFYGMVACLGIGVVLLLVGLAS